MEKLQYVIEDRTIAELLGVQNFSTDESAILELVKNAYDAQASYIKLTFKSDTLTVLDDGVGMNIDDIKSKWMHIGKSTKDYTTVLENNHIRVLAGSKGIGRFALARLGQEAAVMSKRSGDDGILWETDLLHLKLIWKNFYTSMTHCQRTHYGALFFIETPLVYLLMRERKTG